MYNNKAIQLLTDKSLRSGLLSVVTTRLLGVALLLVMQILLSQLVVDPEHYGLYVWSTSLAQLGAVICVMGMGSTSLRFGAEYRSLPDNGSARLLLHTTLAVTLLASCCFCLLGIIWLQWARDWHTEAASNHALLAGLLAMPALALGLWNTGTAVSRQWYTLAFLPERIARPLLIMAMSLVCYYLVPTFSGVHAIYIFLAASLGWSLSQTTILLWRISKQPGLPATHVPKAIRPQLMRQWTGVSAAFFGASLLSAALSYIDVVMLGILTNSAEAAQYFAANRLTQLASLPGMAVAAVLAPRLAAAMSKPAKHSVQMYATVGAHLTLWPSLLIGAAMFSLAEPLLGLFGEQYTQSTNLLAVLLAGHLCAAATGCVGVLLSMSGYQRYNLYALATTVPIYISLNLLLMPRFGAMGGAISMSASLTLLNVIMLWHVRQQMGIHATIFSPRVAP